MLYIHTFAGAKGYGYDEAIFSLIELVYTTAGKTTSTDHFEQVTCHINSGFDMIRHMTEMSKAWYFK